MLLPSASAHWDGPLPAASHTTFRTPSKLEGYFLYLHWKKPGKTDSSPQDSHALPVWDLFPVDSS